MADVTFRARVKFSGEIHLNLPGGGDAQLAGMEFEARSGAQEETMLHLAGTLGELRKLAAFGEGIRAVIALAKDEPDARAARLDLVASEPLRRRIAQVGAKHGDVPSPQELLTDAAWAQAVFALGEYEALSIAIVSAG